MTLPASIKPALSPFIAQGNSAFRTKDYEQAIRLYLRGLHYAPALRKSIINNIELARQRYRSDRDARTPQRVAVCGWDLAHNAAGRAYTLAQLYATFTDVEVIGAVFPKHGGQVWLPIRDTSIPMHTVSIKDQSVFLDQALELVAAHPYDIVHLSKPRGPNILFGMLYKLIWGSRVFMDIDDEELAFVGAQTPLQLNEYLQRYGRLPELKHLEGEEWTRLAVGLAQDFDDVTVSSPALQRLYGGKVIRHARDGQVFRPSADQKRQSRIKFGIPADLKVVLFFGTPRAHKGLLATAKAIGQLGRNDVAFVVVGDFPDAQLKRDLADVKGCRSFFLGSQPFESAAEVVALGDCCMLLQDAESRISAFQTPAKLSDAFGMGLPVLASKTASTEEFISQGAIAEVAPETAHVQLAAALFDAAVARGLAEQARKAFDSHMTFTVVAPVLQDIVSAAHGRCGDSGTNSHWSRALGLEALLNLKSGQLTTAAKDHVDEAQVRRAEVQILLPEKGSSQPDFFSLKAAPPTTSLVICSWVDKPTQVPYLIEAASAIDISYELIVLFPRGQIELGDLSRISGSCLKVSAVGYPEKTTRAGAFVRALNAGVFSRYESLLWFDLSRSPSSVDNRVLREFVGEQTSDVGIVSDQLTELGVINAATWNKYLRTWLSRLHRPDPDLTTKVPQGSLLCRTIILKQCAAVSIDPNNVEAGASGADDGFTSILSLVGVFAAEGGLQTASFNDAHHVFAAAKTRKAPTRSVKTIAFFLPQFHVIPENDAWWGKGFTEWNNVIGAKPLFRSHYQPRLPADLGFYDLRSPATQKAQAELATKYGVHGFCYYYYWFNGKKLLNEPIEQMLGSGSPDFPFCVCWANENWSRNWDGQNRHVLMDQDYSLESNRALIREFIRMMKDKRYIRHHEKPVLLVYRIKIIPNWLETATMWRDECRKAGVGEIHLCSIRFGLEPLEGMPSQHGLDSYVLFPPQDTNFVDMRSSVDDLNPDFCGSLLSYEAVAEGDIARFKSGYPWSVHRGAMLGWDNTARRRTAARVFIGCTPMRYRAWLRQILGQEDQHNPDNESLLFINAWNEWAEGTTLEPDQRYGTSYLEATSSALSSYNLPRQRDIGASDIAPVVQQESRVDQQVEQTFAPPQLNSTVATRSVAMCNAAIPDDMGSAARQNQSPMVTEVISPRPAAEPRVAVILHAFHKDMLATCLDHIAAIRTAFDLIVTTPWEHGDPAIDQILARFPNAQVAHVLNRGRDIAPFLSVWRDLRKYDICCKIHTKKGTTHYADLWRRLCLESLLGSTDTVSAILRAFRDDDQLAIVGPAVLYKSGQKMIGGNAAWLRRLDELMGLQVDKKKPWGFFAGTMFWFRPQRMDHLDALADLEFEPERGLDDGGIEHAVERMFGSRGLHASAKIGLVRLAKGRAIISCHEAPALPDEEPHLVTFEKLIAPPSTLDKLKGNIDRIRPQDALVRGWLALLGDGRPRRAVLQFEPGGDHYVDCAMLRPDLKQSGINEGRHAFEMTVPAQLCDGRDYKLSLIDLISGKLLAQTKGRWEPKLPDLFPLASQEEHGEHAIVMTGYAERHSAVADRFLATVDEEFDLLCPTAAPYHPETTLANCREVIQIDCSPTIAEAALLIHLVNSGVLARYKSICWFRPSTSAPHSGSGMFGRLRADPDIGLIASAITLRGPAAGATAQGAHPHAQNSRRHATAHEIPVGSGTLWIAALPLSELRATAIEAATLLHESDACTVIEWLLSVYVHEGSLQLIDMTATDQTPIIGSPVANAPLDIRTVAFYLPQFHPIPDNDRWWGKGFTEWTNVSRAQPLYPGHHQPRRPADLGFYDLRLPDAQQAQADLARNFHVDAFCYYYYWFNGKKLLNQPIENMLSSGKPDFPFCVCWANENWTRSWDGQNRHVLLEQRYDFEELRALIREFITMMRDPRYLRFRGQPVLLVYRIKAIPNWPKVAQMWRKECQDAGIGDIHLCAVRFGLEPLEGNPHDNGVDSFVLFPPHESAQESAVDEVQGLVSNFSGQILSYEAVIDADLARFEDGYPWPVHRGAMTGWDNTARRGAAARIFVGSTPSRFRTWLKGIVEQEHRHQPPGESLLFINAWNEWAEGTTLEPDRKLGTGNLEAVRSVLGSPSCRNAGANAVVEAKRKPLSVAVPFADMHCLAGARTANPEWPTVLLCGHMVGKELFGGERSFLDVLRALSAMRVNVVVTLPPGEPYRYCSDTHFELAEVNPPYLDEVTRWCSALWVFAYPWLKERKLEEEVVRRFMHVMVEHQVTVVHANTIMLWEPLVAARRLNRATVIHSREMIDHDESLKGFIGWDAERIRQTVLGQTHHMISNSAATGRMFRHPSNFVVPNCVDAGELDLDNQITGKIRFGIVSSNLPKKGIEDFVEVARLCDGQVANAEFVVIGPDNDFIKSLKEAHGAARVPGNLRFLGYQDTPRKAMAEINVLLNLSHFAESFGRTVAEAMAARRPVIAYKWGALPELVQHGRTGFIAPYRDKTAVAAFVRWYCEHPPRLLAMGNDAHEFVVTHYSRDVLKSKLSAAYRTILAQHKPAVAAPAVTVVIPVYNAHDEVRDCLESVARHTPRPAVEVIVIDDGSSDPRISALLSHHEKANGFTVLRNPRNIGYTKTINVGIRSAQGRDVILLNSDTLVTPGWYVGLRGAAYAPGNIGTVTAMSDNAGAFSFPTMGAKNPKPEGMTHNAYAARMLQAAGTCNPVELPTGSGFCMYIRRSLFDAIGLFDEESFPRGYGEENDFCMRALRAGWKNLLSPWSFIYHVRSASFGAEKLALITSGVATVERLYPDYTDLVKAAFGSAEIRALRMATTAGTVKQ